MFQTFFQFEILLLNVFHVILQSEHIPYAAVRLVNSSTVSCKFHNSKVSTFCDFLEVLIKTDFYGKSLTISAKSSKMLHFR